MIAIYLNDIKHRLVINLRKSVQHVFRFKRRKTVIGFKSSNNKIMTIVCAYILTKFLVFTSYSLILNKKSANRVIAVVINVV